MIGIDRQNQPVQKPPPVTGRQLNAELLSAHWLPTDPPAAEPAANAPQPWRDSLAHGFLCSFMDNIHLR